MIENKKIIENDQIWDIFCLLIFHYYRILKFMIKFRKKAKFKEIKRIFVIE